MSRPRVIRLLVLSCVAAAATAALACDRREAGRPADSAIDTAQPVHVAKRPPTDWATELGQLLLVPSDSDNAAVVLYPDEPTSQLIGSAPTTLISVSGETTQVRLVPSDSQQCGDAPMVRLSGAAPAGWSIGLLGRSGALLPMDSIEALPSADSARMAADLARLASGLSTHRDSRFSGLPFAVLTAHRFSRDSRQFLVGHLARRLNQEAAPLEERTLIIAERSAAGAPYSVTYSQRSEGSEDAAEHFEALAAVRGRRSTLLLIARDQISQTNYEVLERVPNGTWRSRWSRKLAC